MANIEVKNVRVADPGIGFRVIGATPNKAVTITVIMTDPDNTAHTSSLHVDKISEGGMTVVLPFGDTTYQSGSVFDFEIRVAVEGETEPTIFKGKATAASRPFVLDRELPHAVLDGGSLGYMETFSSGDEEHIAIMQEDGNFCVYPQYQFGPGKLSATDCSNTYTPNIRTAHLTLDNGTITIYGDNGVVLAESVNSGKEGANLVISKEGKICLLFPGEDIETAAPVQPWQPKH